MTEAIFKIMSRQDWRNTLAEGRYEGSADDLRDGFIHFSTEEQVPETVRRHYAGRSDLVLLSVDPQAYDDALVWEPSRGGALFPHLYAPMTARSVRSVQTFSVSEDGVMVVEDTQ